jgi:hypothetical protein
MNKVVGLLMWMWSLINHEGFVSHCVDTLVGTYDAVKFASLSEIDMHWARQPHLDTTSLFKLLVLSSLRKLSSTAAIFNGDSLRSAPSRHLFVQIAPDVFCLILESLSDHLETRQLLYGPVNSENSSARISPGDGIHL